MRFAVQRPPVWFALGGSYSCALRREPKHVRARSRSATGGQRKTDMNMMQRDRKAALHVE
jgi:hypothetical protein